MRSRLKKIIAGAAIGVGIAFGGTAVPANAADAYVYVVVRDRACGTPQARVYGIQTANITTGWSLNWDRGDNIVYPRVRLNTTNVLKLNLQCRVGTTTVGYTVIQPNIYPTRHQETIWVG